jgi:Holliday junction resolvase RusA-like endonuclease
MELKVKPMSVNDAWQGRRFKTDEYKAYEKQVFYRTPFKVIPKNVPLCAVYEFYFSNDASDIDNPVKPLQDILQKRWKFDDKRIVELIVRKRLVKK